MKFETEGREEGRGRKSFRNAVIVFAVVEALILIPVVLYLILS